MQDESQLLYYEHILKRMPLPVLKNRGVLSVDKGIARLEIDKLSLEEKAAIRLECGTLIQRFIQKKGLRIWDHRVIEDDPVPASLRYRALKRDGGKCLLCGALAKDKPMHVDHIIPRSKGGLNTLENLQTLCFECNGGKNNRDDTDFRTGSSSWLPSPRYRFVSVPQVQNHLSRNSASHDPPLQFVTAPIDFRFKSNNQPQVWFNCEALFLRPIYEGAEGH
jgi:HNH endonuclease